MFLWSPLCLAFPTLLVSITLAWTPRHSSHLSIRSTRQSLSVLGSMPTTRRPRLLVFDLDNTLWTPELYQLRQRRPPTPGSDIDLFEDVKIILRDLAQESEARWGDTQLAVASRTNKVEWAKALLRQFQATPTVSLHDLFDFVEIQTGSKRRHFQNLREASGIPFSDMVFFDDDAKMNLGEVSQMGVLSCHCPRGLTVDLFQATLKKYSDLKENHADGHWMGYMVTAADLGLTMPEQESHDEGRITTGVVKFYNPEKRFGFVAEDQNEFFFHESKVANGLQVRKGMTVSFKTMVDGKGRSSAAILSILNQHESSGTPPSIFPCFSMSQPFVSLLLNGIKTVETRNNPMFCDVSPGTQILLHCGHRDWKDMDAPHHELRKAGYTDEDIVSLMQLPKGFRKGEIVGVVTVGRTWESDVSERKAPELQRQVVADANAIGRYCTVITHAQWLERPFRAKGNVGVFKVTVPDGCLTPMS